MERVKAYISGPISAEIPHTTREERKNRFHLCEDWITKFRPEWEPVNPLKVQACPDFSCGGPAASQMQGVETTDHSWECWMRYDLKALLECNAIVLLPGWDESPGAHMECNIARWLGMRPYFATIDGVIFA